MGHGFASVFTVSMASGESLSTYVDLGGAYPSVYLEIASTPSNSEHRVRAANGPTGTFNTIYHPAINSSTVGANPYAIPTSVTGALVPLPGGFRYMKIHATAVMTNGHTYRIYVGDE